MKRHQDPTAWNKRMEEGDKETQLQESEAVSHQGDRERELVRQQVVGEAHSPRSPELMRD